MYKYFFHIVEPDHNEYNYEAYFFDHYEADIFMDENERDGNVVTMISPYIQYVEKDPYAE